MVKRLPAMWEIWVPSPGWEDPLEKEMATHSSTLAWKVPWMEEPVGYNPWGHKELDTTEWLHFSFVFLYMIHSTHPSKSCFFNPIICLRDHFMLYMWNY